MKLTLKTFRPRNRFAIAASRRAAGAHRTSGGARRRAEQMALGHSLRSAWDDWRKPT